MNLVRLTSKAYTEGFYYKLRIINSLPNTAGLIALSRMSGVPSAMLAQADEAAGRFEFEETLGGNYSRNIVWV